ncbi:MAG TPA: hypothetical protein VNE42_00265, partial [Acidimicrobiales bacterium]|nr:hypothetical protein [Acidimicrobiales bacterium]
ASSCKIPLTGLRSCRHVLFVHSCASKLAKTAKMLASQAMFGTLAGPVPMILPTRCRLSSREVA